MQAIIAALIIILSAPVVAYASDAVPQGRLPEAVTPQHYRLTLDIDPRQESFSGRADIDVSVATTTSALWLDGLGLKVGTVIAEAQGRKISGRYEEIDHETGVARIALAKPLPAGPATLHLQYQASFQSSPQGLYRTKAGNDWYVFSQMEAIDARRVFPGFDEPRFKTPFDITIVTHSRDRAISNSPEVRMVALKGGAERHEYLTTKPLPTYLLAFAVGPLDVAEAAPIPANATRHEPLPFRVIGIMGQAAAFAFALKETPDLVRRLEEYFGTPFPYPKLDLIASPIHLGAMENAGAIIFTDSLLALGPDPTPRQQSNFGVVAAHELAHQWFGDLVTPAWWDDIWLNESFAEWMGSKISDEWRPGLGIQKEQLDSTVAAMDIDALQAGRPIHQLVTSNKQIGATFDSITYEKGAGVIAMVESYLGTERFRRGVRLHLQRHAYGTATASEFFAAMAEASGEPAVIDAFRSFVDQPGLPLVAVSSGRDGQLVLEQSIYRPLGPSPAGNAQWHIPFCARVYTDLKSSTACTLLSGARGSLALPAGQRDGTVHPNADGAGYYRFTVDPALLHALLRITPEMSARETIMLADSISSAFEAGRLSFADFYAAAKVLALHPDRTAALSLGYKLDNYGARLASPEERILVERALVSLYKSRLVGLGYDVTPGRYSTEPAEQQLLRRQLIQLVGLSGRDPEVRRALAGAAAASVSSPARIEPLLRWRVWAIGLQENGAPLVAPLKTLVLESRDPAIREDAALALANAEGPDVANNVRDFALDPKVDVRSALGIVFTQVNNPRTSEASWSWFTAHQDAVINRIPAMFQSFVAQVGAQFCSPAERQAFDRQVGARIRSLSGGEIAVNRTLEQIDNCSALRAYAGTSINTTLAAELAAH